MAVHIHEHRVIFGDTDAMGIVYYGNYLRYFEVARSEWFRKFYLPPTRMVKDENYLIVLKAHANYINPAVYDDILVIESWVPTLMIKPVTLRFEFEIKRKRDSLLLVNGYTSHAFTDKDGKLKRMPKKFVSALNELSEDRRIEDDDNH